MADVHPTAIVYPGTVLGEGVKVLEYAVVGKQPSLSPRSTTKREHLPPAVVGDGSVISTGAVLFAGTKVGARVILGDQSCVRERVTIGDDVVVGRGSLVENDTTIGALTKIQADAYITAYSTLEDNVFIAPFVGAGAVVVKDVPPRAVVVGNPARVLREVPDEELLS